EIERRVTAFAQSANGGLIVTASALSGVHRNLIAMLAARHKLPSVSSVRVLAAAGVVVSYGPNLSNQYRQAAGYVDRILKGEKPADLPVQAPRRAAHAARPRRRGDRIGLGLLHLLTAGFGTKRRTTMLARMSALGGKSGLDMLTSSSSAHDPERS